LAGIIHSSMLFSASQWIKTSFFWLMMPKLNYLFRVITVLQGHHRNS